MGDGGRAFGSWGLALLTSALFLLSGVPVLGSVGAPGPLSAHSPATPSTPAMLPHPHSAGLGLPKGVGPAASGTWYTQEGATFAQINGSSLVAGLRSIGVTIPLVYSPYGIGYELNGLSNTGDWYQVVVGENWPSCPGYEFITEIWDKTGGTSVPTCDTTVAMSTGNLIELRLNFTSGGAVCLGLNDKTTAHSNLVCTAQPDSGATRFIPMLSSANTNGYFTGPMTEIANITATSCPDYTFMPLVNYDWTNGFWLSELVPWSDEWEFGGASTSCYSGGGSLMSIVPGDPTTQYLDTALGTSYGPHVVAAQNLSLLGGSYGERIQTDAVPLISVGVGASRTSTTVNVNVTLTATVSGGASPYTALWNQNNVPLGAGPVVRSWSAPSAGTYSLTAFGVDKNQDVIGPSTAVRITVSSPLVTPSVTVSTPTGNADVLQSVVFSAVEAGGLPPIHYSWLGLPVECPSQDLANLQCGPTGAGFYNVSVQLSDANGSVLVSPARPFVVSPTLSAAVQLTAPAVDPGQSVSGTIQANGGSGGNVFGWSGWPTECTTTLSGTMSCRPSVPGAYLVTATVQDVNGFLVITQSAPLQVYNSVGSTLTSSRLIVDAGANLTLQAHGTGGAAGYSYAWTSLPSGCASANTSSLTCAATQTGSFGIVVTVTDRLGASAASSPLTVYVYPPINVSVQGNGQAQVGDSITLTESILGGSGGVVVRWDGLPIGCLPPTGATLVCQPTSAGSYNVTVTVTDVGGGSATSVLHIVVTYMPTSSGPPLLPAPWLLVLLIVGVAAVVAAGIAWSRRRP